MVSPLVLYFAACKNVGQQSWDPSVSLVSDDGCEETMIQSDTKIPALKIPQTFTLTIPPYYNYLMFYVVVMLLDTLVKKPLKKYFLTSPKCEWYLA